jgi:hypothetical protein
VHPHAHQAQADVLQPIDEVTPRLGHGGADSRDHRRDEPEAEGRGARGGQRSDVRCQRSDFVLTSDL